MVMPKDLGGTPRSAGGISGGGGRNVSPINRELSPSAQKSIAEARKALGASKPDPKALARKITQDKAREAERIRKQGRNTR